jgi:hypothetical protein
MPARATIRFKKHRILDLRPRNYRIGASSPLRTAVSIIAQGPAQSALTYHIINTPHGVCTHSPKRQGAALASALTSPPPRVVQLPGQLPRAAGVLSSLVSLLLSCPLPLVLSGQSPHRARRWSSPRSSNRRRAATQRW